MDILSNMTRCLTTAYNAVTITGADVPTASVSRQSSEGAAVKVPPITEIHVAVDASTRLGTCTHASKIHKEYPYIRDNKEEFQKSTG